MGDTGSAALEFIAIGCLLLVPLVYLMIALGAIQSQSLGAESGARHIARVISQSPDATSALSRADAILRSTAAEYGLDPSAVELSLSCVPASVTCPEAGATVVVRISTRVRLPLIPGFLGLTDIASVPVEATAAQKVSRFWGSE